MLMQLVHCLPAVFFGLQLQKSDRVISSHVSAETACMLVVSWRSSQRAEVQLLTEDRR